MGKKLFTTLLLLFCIIYTINAQKTITGRVKKARDNRQLPGVSIVVKGTTVGALTDRRGRYRIKVPEKFNTLVFSHGGMKTEEIDINDATVINVKMISLYELGSARVISIFGNRDIKTLGYSIQNLNGADMAISRQPNIINSFAGKVWGAETTSASGQVGASARMVIRGNSTLSANNQPLFVVDGLPLMNIYDENNGYNGIDYGNSIDDININDIASVLTVKGAEAALMFGPKAANGAILITTKSGRDSKKFGIQFESNISLQIPFLLPNYQNKYGQGLDGKFSFIDGKNGGIMDGVTQSWGPELDNVARNQFNGSLPWAANPDNVKNVFQTGMTRATSLAFTGNREKTNIRLGLTNIKQKGMLPNTGESKNIIALNSGTAFTNNFIAKVSLNYIKTKGDNYLSNGFSDNNIMKQFAMFGRQVDTEALKEYENEDGTPINWNYSEHDNPYWILNKNTNSRNRNHLYGNLTLKYYFASWLNLKLSLGSDYLTEERFEKRAKYSINYPDGGYSKQTRTISQTDTRAVLTYEDEFLPDFDLNVSLGANLSSYAHKYNGVNVNGLSNPDLYTLSNATNIPELIMQSEQEELQSGYALASISYRDLAYIDFGVRADRSSVLPVDNPLSIYPSASASVLISNMFDMPIEAISLAKVRGSFASASTPPGSYIGQNNYQTTGFLNENNAFTYTNSLINNDLIPETTTTIDFGVDIIAFRNKLSLSYTYYLKSTKDFIINQTLSGASGYEYKTINAGTIKNKGMEVNLNMTVAQHSKYKWDIGVNWSYNKNTVEGLPNKQPISLYNYMGLDIQAREGEPLGVMYGQGLVRQYPVKDELENIYQYSGSVVIDSDGIPLVSNSAVVIGNVTPKWIGSVVSKFWYNDFSLEVLFDVRYGGKIFSGTNMYGTYSGIAEETEKGRQGGLLVEGVRQLYDGSYISNNIECTNVEDLWKTMYDVPEAHIFDGSYIKIREVILSYELPIFLANKFGMEAANISIVGRNLWNLYSNVPNLDPENSFGAGYSSQAIEFGALPSARSFGFNLRLSF